MFRTPMRTTNQLILAALLSLPLLSGCLPNVAWLPDGGGIVYTEDNFRRLVRYDLNTKTRKVLAEDTGARTIFPAVSPDGKQVAVAAIKQGGAVVQFILYDLNGNKVATHGFGVPAPAGQAQKSDDLHSSFVAWGPDGHAIVYDTKDKKTWIFDTKARQLVKVVSKQPIFKLGAPIGPKGGGFLASGGAEFVDWSGKVHPLKGKDKVEQVLSDKAPDKGPGWELTWQGWVAQVTFPGKRVALDTKAHTVKSQKLDDPVLLDEKKVVTFHTFPDSPVVLCLREHPKSKPFQPYQGGGGEKYQIEVQNLKDKSRKLLVEECLAINPFSPSPDRKLVAVRIMISNKQGGKLNEGVEKILIVDDQGEVRHQLDVDTTVDDYKEKAAAPPKGN